MKKSLTACLVLSGVLMALGIPAGLDYLSRTYHLTPRQAFLKGAERLSVSNPAVLDALAPPARYRDHRLDGRIKSGHPRILALDTRGWNGESFPPPFLRDRQAHFAAQQLRPPDPCAGTTLLHATLCWLGTGKAGSAERAMALLQSFRPIRPNVRARYGDAWKLALAYDLLALHPRLDAETGTRVRAELREALKDYLKLLDAESASLWHGRASLAASAWLCAVMLDPERDPDDRALVARAQGHFLDLMGALGTTEAWPEGYNYWIQTRAFLLALAASAYVNGLEDSALRPEISRIMEQVGLWPLYAMRPDRRVENLGDEGSRVDLKDETQRVVDLIAQTTRNPTLSRFSGFLRKLHGVEGYYRGHRWGLWLFQDPTLSPAGGDSMEADLRHFDRVLPKARLFGRGAMNLVYIRSGWDADATFISYRAGHSFTHHGHYDAGHFSLYKGAPLAVNSSRYGDGIFSSNRLNYSIRTIAKNALLILRPGETVQPNRFFAENVADGGQRLTLPTGSAISGLQDWRDNLHSGAHYEGGELLAYDHAEGIYTYVASDLTGAYNNTRFDDNGRGGKVGRVQRELLYLAGEDRLVIHDRLALTRPTFPVKWLLHTANKPWAGSLKVLKGSDDDGILASPEKSALVVNGRGRLRLDWLLPKEGELRLVGGPNHRFYVEADADETVLDGRNFAEGASEQPWFDKSDWRLELHTPGGDRNREFLVVLSPSLDQPQPGTARLVQAADGTAVVGLAESTLIFLPPRRPVDFSRPVTGRDLYLIGELGARTVTIDGEKTELPAAGPAVFHRRLPPAAGHTVMIRG